MGEPKLITLHIKATNPSMKDTFVKAQEDWTVRNLKEHLSSVFPNQPPHENQKLIYSGQLLKDECVVSELLKSYEGEINNVIHLVCTLPKELKNARNSSTPSTTTSSMSTENLERHDRENFADILNSELNARGRLFTRNGNFFMNNMTPNEQNAYQNMFWMQQAYAQYMSYYIHLAYMQNGRSINDFQPAAQAQNPPPPAQNRNEEDGEDEGQRPDWLDFVYILSRLAVLLSLVYLYSSALRFMLVIAMGLLLYHLGLIQWRRGPNAALNNPDVNNPDRVAEPPPQQADDSPANTPTHQRAQTPQNPAVHAPHWLSICWTFVSSFFLSLIPDQRDV